MKPKALILCFDQTFEGFLSAVHTAIDEKLEVNDIRPENANDILLFNEVRHVPADREKARLVWDGIREKGTSHLRLVYFAYLSENRDLLLPIFEYVIQLFRTAHPGESKRLSVLREKVSPWAQRVEREKQKLEKQLQFSSQNGEFRYCRLHPVYNTLPLLTRYCRQHFGSVPWMLIDTRRNFGFRNKAGGVECFRLPVRVPPVPDKTEHGAGEEILAKVPFREKHPLQAAV